MTIDLLAPNPKKGKRDQSSKRLFIQQSYFFLVRKNLFGKFKFLRTLLWSLVRGQEKFLYINKILGPEGHLVSYEMTKKSLTSEKWKVFVSFFVK